MGGLITMFTNKKGIAPAIAIVLAVFLGIVFLGFLGGGGFSATWDFAKLINSMIDFMRTIPTFVWVILGVIILFKMIGGKRRR